MPKSRLSPFFLLLFFVRKGCSIVATARVNVCVHPKICRVNWLK